MKIHSKNQDQFWIAFDGYRKLNKTTLQKANFIKDEKNYPTFLYNKLIRKGTSLNIKGNESTNKLLEINELKGENPITNNQKFFLNCSNDLNFVKSIAKREDSIKNIKNKCKLIYDILYSYKWENLSKILPGDNMDCQNSVSKILKLE